MSTDAGEKVDRQTRILEAVLTLLSQHGISGVSTASRIRVCRSTFSPASVLTGPG